MSLLVPCDVCSSRAPGKLAWLAWAWNRADHTRTAYKQRLCLQCFLQRAWPLLNAEVDSLFSCPVCHCDPSDSLDPIYLTYIIPGSPQQLAELPTCASCAVKVRGQAQEGAALLPDREDSVGASRLAPTTPSTSGWDALGSRPQA